MNNSSYDDGPPEHDHPDAHDSVTREERAVSRATSSSKSSRSKFAASSAITETSSPSAKISQYLDNSMNDRGLHLNQRPRYDILKCSRAVLARSYVVDTRIGKYEVPSAFTTNPAEIHNPSISALNRMKVGIPVRRIRNFGDFWELSALKDHFVVPGPKIGSDVSSSLRIGGHSSLNPQRKKNRNLTSREAKTKPRMEKKNKRNVPPPASKQKRSSNDVLLLNADLRSSEIRTIWNAYRSVNMKYVGVFNKYAFAWQALCRTQPLFATTLLTDLQAKKLRIVLASVIADEYENPPVPRKPSINKKFLIGSTFYDLEILSTSPFRRSENIDSDLAALSKFLTLRVEQGKLSVVTKTNHKFRYYFKNALYTADSLSRGLASMGIKIYLDAGVAYSGFSDQIAVFVKQIRELGLQAAEALKQHPILFDVIMFFILYAFAELYGIDQAFAFAGILTYLGTSKLLEAAVDNFLSAFRAEKEIPVAFADTWSISSAFSNALGALLGKDFDPKRLESDAKAARAFTALFSFTVAAQKVAVGILSILTSFLPWLYEKIFGEPWSTDEVEKILGRHAASANALTLHMDRKISLPPNVVTEHTHTLYESYMALSPKHNRYEVIRKTTLEIFKRLSDWLDAGANESTRIVPVHVVVNGETGTGKTKNSGPLMVALNSKCGVADDSIYCPVVSSQYHENYRGQNVTLLDDHGQSKDVQLAQKLALDLFYMVSSSPYPMDAAAVEKKGNVWFSSNFIITTSNLATDVMARDVNIPDAFKRRVHFDVYISHSGNTPMETRYGIRPTSHFYNWTLEKLPDLPRNQAGDIDIEMAAFADLCYDLHLEFKRQHTAFCYDSPEFRLRFPKAAVPESVQQLKDGISAATSAGVAYSATDPVEIDDEEVAAEVARANACLGKTLSTVKSWILSPFTFYKKIRAMQDAASRYISLLTVAIKMFFIGVIASVSALIVYLVYKKWNAKEDNFENTMELISSDAHAYHPRGRVDRRPMQQMPTNAWGLVDAERAKLDRNLGRITIGDESHAINFVCDRWAISTAHILKGSHPSALIVVETFRDRQIYAFAPESVRIVVEDIDDRSYLEFPEKDLNGKHLESFADITSHFARQAPPMDASGFNMPVLVQGQHGQWTESVVRGNISAYRYEHKPSHSQFSILAFPMKQVGGPGDCVHYVTKTVPDSDGFILGVICSGNADFTFAAILTRDRLLRVVKPAKVQAHGYVKREGLANPSSSLAKTLTTNLTRAVDLSHIVDTASNKPVMFSYPAAKTRFIPNPKAHEFLRTLVAPAHLEPFHLETGERLDPLAIRLRKLDIIPSEDKVDYGLMYQTMMEIDNRIHGENRYNFCTREEAFFGCSIKKYPGFQTSSAAGLIDGKKCKIKDCFTFVDGVPTLTPAFHAECEKAKTDPWLYPATVSKKDELLEMLDVLLGKMRLFCAMHVVKNTRGKQALNPYLAALRANGMEEGIRIGTAFGKNFACLHLVQRLKRHGKAVKLLMGDIRNYEKIRRRNMWTARRDTIKLRYPIECHAEIDALFEELYNPWLALGNILFKVIDFMTSGNFATAEFNSLDTIAAIRYTAKCLGCESDILDIGVYGDDFYVVVPEGSRLTNWSLRDSFESTFGWGLTPPDKNSELPEYYEIKDFTFCQRNVVNGNLVLARDNLFSAGGWMKDSYLRTGVDTGLQAIGSMLQEASRYNDNMKTYEEVLYHYKSHTDYTENELRAAASESEAYSKRVVSAKKFAKDGGFAYSGRASSSAPPEVHTDGVLSWTLFEYPGFGVKPLDPSSPKPGEIEDVVETVMIPGKDKAEQRFLRFGFYPETQITFGGKTTIVRRMCLPPDTTDYDYKELRATYKKKVFTSIQSQINTVVEASLKESVLPHSFRPHPRFFPKSKIVVEEFRDGHKYSYDKKLKLVRTDRIHTPDYDDAPLESVKTLFAPPAEDVLDDGLAFLEEEGEDEVPVAYDPYNPITDEILQKFAARFFPIDAMEYFALQHSYPDISLGRKLSFLFCHTSYQVFARLRKLDFTNLMFSFEFDLLLVELDSSIPILFSHHYDEELLAQSDGFYHVLQSVEETVKQTKRSRIYVDQNEIEEIDNDDGQALYSSQTSREHIEKLYQAYDLPLPKILPPQSISAMWYHFIVKGSPELEADDLFLPKAMELADVHALIFNGLVPSEKGEWPYKTSSYDAVSVISILSKIAPETIFWFYPHPMLGICHNVSLEYAFMSPLQTLSKMFDNVTEKHVRWMILVLRKRAAIIRTVNRHYRTLRHDYADHSLFRFAWGPACVFVHALQTLSYGRNMLRETVLPIPNSRLANTLLPPDVRAVPISLLQDEVGLRQFLHFRWGRPTRGASDKPDPEMQNQGFAFSKYIHKPEAPKLMIRDPTVDYRLSPTVPMDIYLADVLTRRHYTIKQEAWFYSYAEALYAAYHKTPEKAWKVIQDWPLTPAENISIYMTYFQTELRASYTFTEDILERFYVLKTTFADFYHEICDWIRTNVPIFSTITRMLLDLISFEFIPWFRPQTSYWHSKPKRR